MVYKMDAYPLSRALLDDEIQCQSASILVALRWLQSPHTQVPGGPRPVFVYSPNHVQPGLLYEGKLVLMEGTSTGSRVTELDLDDLHDARVIDAKSAMVWSLLHDRTPEQLRSEMLLHDSHGGPVRFSTGSGGDSWVHLPLSFGGPIIMDPDPIPLSADKEPSWATFRQLDEDPSPAVAGSASSRGG